MPFGDEQSDVRRLWSTVCSVLLSLWFVVLEFEERISERIFWYKSERKALLGVEMRMGNRVWSSLTVGSVDATRARQCFCIR